VKKRKRESGCRDRRRGRERADAETDDGGCRRVEA